MDTPTRIKVKRDGPRGWHWIAAAHFDPAVHELFEEAPPPAPEAAPITASKPAKGKKE